MSVFFNADYESSLFLGQYDKIEFSKVNQEFEYLLFWIQEQAVYSQVQYSKDFLDHLREEGQFNPKVTLDKQNVKLWFGNFEDAELKKKINSKLFALELCQKYNFNKYTGHTIESKDEYDPKLLTRLPYGMSGVGTYESLDEKKLDNMLSKGQLIQVPKLNRQKDISSLWTGTSFVTYENYVDEKFQYKGSILGEDSLGIHQKKYQDFLNQVQKELPQNLIYSIDSFIYRDNGKEELFFMCEVNLRKTMGYIVWQLSSLYAKGYGHKSFLLIPKRRVRNKEKFYSLRKRDKEELILPLSPIEKGRFLTVFFAANSLSDLRNIRESIYSALGFF